MKEQHTTHKAIAINEKGVAVEVRGKYVQKHGKDFTGAECSGHWIVINGKNKMTISWNIPDPSTIEEILGAWRTK